MITPKYTEKAATITDSVMTPSGGRYGLGGKCICGRENLLMMKNAVIAISKLISATPAPKDVACGV